jgi:hypothetical protein
MVFGGGPKAGRVYVFTKVATRWKQVAELEGPDPAAGDTFGYSVAISGTTIAVSAARGVYVFTKTATGWMRVAQLKGSDGSVAVSGATIVVGEPSAANFAGRAYVFTKVGAVWKQAAELKGSDTVFSDNFGSSVAISGTTVVVGAPSHAGAGGRAYVFTKTAAVWKQAAELKGSDTVALDNLGSRVAISGTTVVTGAPGHASNAGRAYVFTKVGSVWKQAAELVGSDTVGASSTRLGDTFGISVAASGTTVLVGADLHANLAGRAYVFTKVGADWKQAAELKGSNTVAGDSFGAVLAVSGSIALVSGSGHAKYAGRAYLFEI